MAIKAKEVWASREERRTDDLAEEGRMGCIYIYSMYMHYQHTHTHTQSSRTHTYTHTFTHSHTHSLTHSQSILSDPLHFSSLPPSLSPYLSCSLVHPLPLKAPTSLSLPPSLTVTHSLTPRSPPPHVSHSLSLCLSGSPLILKGTYEASAGGVEVKKVFYLTGAETERRALERLLLRRAEFTGQSLDANAKVHLYYFILICILRSIICIL